MRDTSQVNQEGTQMVEFGIGAGAVNSPGGLYALVGAHAYLAFALLVVAMVLFRKHRMGYFYRKSKRGTERSVYLDPPMHQTVDIEGFIAAELSPKVAPGLRLVSDETTEVEVDQHLTVDDAVEEPKPATELKLDGTDPS
jgi:hypothetical protein